MAPTRMFFQGKVDAGVELLDQVEPGWASRIDLGRLGMAWHGRDLLSQLFGTFGAGLIRLDIKRAESQRYGFEIGLFPPAYLLGFILYPVLTIAWKMEIEARQRAHAAA